MQLPCITSIFLFTFPFSSIYLTYIHLRNFVGLRSFIRLFFVFSNMIHETSSISISTFTAKWNEKRLLLMRFKRASEIRGGEKAAPWLLTTCSYFEKSKLEAWMRRKRKKKLNNKRKRERKERVRGEEKNGAKATKDRENKREILAFTTRIIYIHTWA